MPQLQRLTLETLGHVLDHSIFAALEEHTTLTQLDVVDCDWLHGSHSTHTTSRADTDDNRRRSLRSIGRIHSLTALSLNGSDVECDDLYAITQLSALHTLALTHLFVDMRAALALSQLKKLQRLHVLTVTPDALAHMLDMMADDLIITQSLKIAVRSTQCGCSSRQQQVHQEYDDALAQTASADHYITARKDHNLM